MANLSPQRTSRKQAGRCVERQTSPVTRYLQWVATTGMRGALVTLLLGCAMVWGSKAVGAGRDTDEIAIVGVLVAFASAHALALSLLAAGWLLSTRTASSFRATMLKPLSVLRSRLRLC